MSIIENRLKGLTAGTVVRITQTNGVTFEGVVCENDGKDSLSIEIMTEAVLRYSGIAGIELVSGTMEGKVNVPAAVMTKETTVKTKPAFSYEKMKEDMPKFSSGLTNFENTFKKLDRETRMSVQGQLSKIRAGNTAHDCQKIETGANEVWNIIIERGLDYDPTANLFVGYAYYLANNFIDASISFFYGDDIHSAYLCALTHAIKENDTELYRYAAVFAAEYVMRDPKGEYLSEALQALEIASAELNDMAAVSLVAENRDEEFIRSCIHESLVNMAKNKNVDLPDRSNIGSMLETLKGVCSNDVLSELLNEYHTESESGDITETGTPDVSDVGGKSGQNVPVTDLNKEYVGRIVSFNFFERKGVIENEAGVQYPFNSKDITDPNFRAKIDGLSKKDFEPVDVQFYLSKNLNAFAAVRIRKCTDPSLIKHGMTYANFLFSSQKYFEAIKEYEKLIANDFRDDALIGMMNCYLALDKLDPAANYLLKMTELMEEYGDKIKHTVKNLSVVHQFYMKANKYDKALRQLDELIALSGEHEYKRILYCVCEKARCYRGQKRYPEAIEQYEYWIKQVNEKRHTDLYIQRDTYIYPETSNLYFTVEDYDNAEKYILLSQSKEKKAILQEIEQKRAEQREKLKADIEESYDAEEAEADIDEDELLTEETETYDFGDLASLISEYHDDVVLEVPAADILKKAMSFGKEQLYCVITYLAAAAYAGRAGTYAEELTAADICFKTAAGVPGNDESLTSSDILYRFTEFKDIMPDMYEPMLAAAALRKLFEQTEEPDYEYPALYKSMEDMQLAKDCPALLQFAEKLVDFRNITGMGVSEFSDYKTDAASFDRVLEAAVKCRESIDMKQNVFESKGRLRRTRQLLFNEPESILRYALDAACDNDTSKLKEIKTRLTEAFIRSGRPFEFSNIDNTRLDDLLDASWDKARDIMIAEKRNVNRPYERLIDPKRRNVHESMIRVLKCVFDWIEASERASDKENYHAKATYLGYRDDMIAMLGDICKYVTDKQENEDRWDIRILSDAVKELLAKLDGSYEESGRKFFYIRFLLTDDILLDDSYLPEIYATLMDKPGFNILRRIERHAAAQLPGLAERIDDLFSNDISKNDLRSASLLRSYAEEMDIDEVSQHNMFNYYDRCVSMGRARLKDIHEDFLNQLELYQSYGALSDINGEKTAMVKESDIFFRICFTCCDLGFYAGLISAYNEAITASSEEIAERLNRQLDELELNPKYEWGIYSKEEIKGFIADRNFSVAENMMNCIRRNDTKELTDFSIEPFGYLTAFLNEHSTNYKAVQDASVTLDASVRKYTGKNDIEVALLKMTNNARKDVRGGASLIKNWITRTPAGAQKVEKLMNNLGFANITVTEEAGTADDSYLVIKAKQSGRVNYHYPLPAYSSVLEQEGIRVVCLYGKFDADRLIDKYREINTTSKHTIVLLDYALKLADRKHLARKLKEEKSFSKTFLLIDRVILYYLALHYQSNTIDKALMSVTMPFCYYQPFSATSRLGKMPPELYTGRAAELKSIEDPNGCNLVYGGRQLGKSALLGMAAKHIDGNANGDRAIVIDITKMDHREAAKAVSENLVDKHILPEGSECEDWDTLARNIGKRLDDDDPNTRIGYLLLMLDEADRFIDSCKEVDYKPITVFKNLPEGRFKLVMAGLHSLSNFNRSILYNNSVLPHLESIIVRPFQRPEGTELLTHALAYMGFRFEPDVIQLILARTNYFPGLIQLYCQKLLEALQNDDYAGYNEVNTPPYEVTESHIKKVLSDKNFTEEIDKRLWMTLTVDESEGSYYMVLALILAYLYFEQPDIKGHSMADMREAAASCGIKTITALEDEQLDEILLEMWDLNIITADETPDGRRYMFSSEGFRDLLGSRETVEKDLMKYMKAGDAE